MIFTRTHWRCGLAILALATYSGCGSRDPRTPEEARRRGDELVRKMSDTLKAAPAFSVTVSESHERVARNGTKQPYTLEREVVIRRPDRLWFHTSGADRDLQASYDGKTVTVVGARQKIYAIVPARPTLDETLDLVSERYDLRIAVADFLYSSPYDSFVDAQAQGGWVRRVDVAGTSCEEMTYTVKQVDFTLSVTSAEPTLPCQAQITYKDDPGKPVSRLVFSKWNLSVQPADTQFVANVPEGYEKIPVVERIPKTELKSDAAKAMGAASGPSQTR